MKFRPILFSTPMVKAILDGTKTQTRRIVKYNKKIENPDIGFTMFTPDDRFSVRGIHENGEYGESFFKAKARTGNIFWVREMHYAKGFWEKSGVTKSGKQRYSFKDNTAWDRRIKGCGYRFFDSEPDEICGGRSSKRGYYRRPSIFMPKEACRIFLEVTNVRVERLHDISNKDAESEGISKHRWCPGYKHYSQPSKFIPFIDTDAERTSFFSLWMSINGAESLDSNPWVFAYDFKRIEKPENFNQ